MLIWIWNVLCLMENPMYFCIKNCFQIGLIKSFEYCRDREIILLSPYLFLLSTRSLYRSKYLGFLNIYIFEFVILYILLWSFFFSVKIYLEIAIESSDKNSHPWIACFQIAIILIINWLYLPLYQMLKLTIFRAGHKHIHMFLQIFLPWSVNSECFSRIPIIFCTFI